MFFLPQRRNKTTITRKLDNNSGNAETHQKDPRPDERQSVVADDDVCYVVPWGKEAGDADGWLAFKSETCRDM